MPTPRRGRIPTVSLTHEEREARAARHRKAIADEMARRTRDAQAVELRMAGATYQDIADQLKYASRGKAYEAIHQVLRRVDIQAGAADLKELEDARLDRLMRAHWVKAISGNDKWAAQYVLKLSESRRKLHGLDAPVKHSLRVQSKLDAEIEDLCSQLGISTAEAEQVMEAAAAADEPAADTDA